MKRGERKHFELKPLSRAPRKPHTVLSNTCAVRTKEKSGYCYIKFSDSLVTFVGKLLPRGVADFDPAYLEVVENGATWEVYASYFLDGASVLLWKTGTRPSWIGIVKEGKGNGRSKARTKRTANGTADLQGAATAQDSRGASGTHHGSYSPCTPGAE